MYASQVLITVARNIVDLLQATEGGLAKHQPMSTRNSKRAKRRAPIPISYNGRHAKEDKTPLTAAVRAAKKPRLQMVDMDVRHRKSLLSSMVLSASKSPANSSSKEKANEVTPSPKEVPAMKTTTSPLDMLPDEVLGHAFFSGYVNSIDITTKITMLNRRTRQVAKNSVKMLDLRALPKMEARHVAAIVARHGNVSSMDFAYCSQFGREHLLALVPVSGTLRNLCLRGTNLRDEDIVAYLDAVINHLGGEPSGLVELDLSCIKREETSRIGDAAVSKIVNCCPQLQSLHLGWCKGVTDKCLSELKNLRRLKDLDLSLTSISEKACRDLANIHELESLDLSATGIGNQGIQDLLVEDPRRLTRLQLVHLKLPFNAAMTGKSLALLATQMPSLKTLDIRHCDLDKNDSKETFLQFKENGTEVMGGGN
jgi:hypothetical protein